MTVRELIEALEQEDPEAEVRYMEQPNYPFEYSVGRSLWRPDEAPDYDDPQYGGTGFAPAGGGNVVYLVEGEQLGYGTRDAWS